MEIQTIPKSSLPATAAAPVAQAAAAAKAAGATGTAANISVSQLAARLNKSSRGTAAAGQPAPTEQSAGAGGDPTGAPEGQEAGAGPEGEEGTADGTGTETGTEGTEETQQEGTEGTEETGTETETTDGTETEAGTAKEEVTQYVLDAVKEFGADPSKVNKKLIGRLHAIVDQRDAQRNERLRLTEEVAKLTEQVKAGGNGNGGGMPMLNPAGYSPEVAQLDQQIAENQRVLEWADANPDGGEVDDGKGKTRSFTAEEVRKIRARSNTALTQLSVKREAKVDRLTGEHTTAVKAAQAQAKALYPWVDKETTPEFLAAQSLLREVPEITLRHDWPLVVTDYAAGRAAREAKEKANGTRRPGAPFVKPAANRTPPKVNAAAPANARPATSAATEANKAVEAAQAQFRKTGRQSDLAKLIAARGRAAGARQN